MEENFVTPPKIFLKRSQKEIDNINKKKLQYQPMTVIKKEETVCLMFSYCASIPKIKPNTNWQMGILFKTVCLIGEIASIVALH